MNRKIKIMIAETKEALNEWVRTHYINLGIFNATLLLLVLLRSAGYFHPYLPLTVNIIIFLSLVMAIFLLGFKSREMFIITITFWLFAGVLQLLFVNIWAERTGIYAYQALFLGVALFMLENLRKRRKK